jgi:glycosyltransferase involved in cell wall biosynthesis
MLVNKLNYGGGAERALAALATHLPRSRFRVSIGTTRPTSGPLLESLVAQGIPHLDLHRKGRFDVRAFRHLTTFLRREHIDVLHAHMFGSNLWGSLFGRLSGVPAVIAHEQTWSYEGQALRKFLDGHVIARLADAFVAVSERDRRRMIELEGVPPGKIVLLPNPYVPRNGPGGPSVDVRAQFAIPPDAPVVGTVAVLRPQKALHVLVDAFHLLSERVPDARLVIGGHGPCGPELESRAAAHGIADRVHLTGWLEDVPAFLRDVDVAAMSSDYEGSPLFALECMAHHTPLVSTDVGNIGEILGDGQGVRIVPRRDPAALAGALEALLRDPVKRRAQAELAASRLRPYEIDNVVAEFADLYTRLVESRERRSPAGRTQAS